MTLSAISFVHNVVFFLKLFSSRQLFRTTWQCMPTARFPKAMFGHCILFWLRSTCCVKPL